jgi:ABC-type Fe3+-hydroxamate transport system substrate-binding protein
MSAPRVYVQVGATPPRAAAQAIIELVDAAGGLSFRPTPGVSSHEVSWEEVLEFDPQLVVYAIEGQGRRFDPTEFLGIEGWDKTEAAVMRRVFSVDAGFFEGPGAMKALLDECFGKGPELEHPGLRRLFEPE